MDKITLFHNLFEVNCDMEQFVNNWTPPPLLAKYFTPTRFDRSGEIRKADIKNYNLPILQYWFNGDELDPLKCLITGQPGFIDFPNIVSGAKKQRFSCDFNHIRQIVDSMKCTGKSIDKGKSSPSHIFRTYKLDADQHVNHLIEMMTTMPINTSYHTYITQDSQKSNINLQNFKKEWWPWGLKNKTNFNKFCKQYNLDLDYDKFIGVLTDVTAENILICYKQGIIAK